MKALWKRNEGMNQAQQLYKNDFKYVIKNLIFGCRNGIDCLFIIRRLTQDTYHMRLYKDAIKERELERQEKE